MKPVAAFLPAIMLAAPVAYSGGSSRTFRRHHSYSSVRPSHRSAAAKREFERETGYPHGSGLCG